VLAAAPGSAVTAQQLFEVTGEPSCSACSITLEEGTLIGSFDDERWIGDSVRGVITLSTGETVVAGFLSEPLLKYNEGGRFRTELGKVGRGPGELHVTLGLRHLDEDRIAVIQAGRITIMDAEGSILDEKRASFISSASALRIAPDGDILYSEHIPRPGTAGRQLHVFDRDMEHTASFGPVSARDQACAKCRRWAATWSSAHPDHFWTVAPNRYELELWHESGELVRRLVVADSPWFEEWTGQEGAHAPLTDIFALEEDEDGLLWVTAKVPSEDWESYDGEIPSVIPRNMPPALAAYFANRWDTLIEVVDPAAGRVVARTRFEDNVIIPTDGSMYRWKQQNDLGLVRVQLIEAELRGLPGGPPPS